MATEPDPREVDAIVQQIKPLLAGRSPEIQGGVLGDLVSMFVAGHHPALRDEVLQMHVDLVRALLPVNLAMMFPNGEPEGWKTQ